MGAEGISQVSSMEDEDFLQHILFTSPTCTWDPNLNPNPQPQPQLRDLVSSPHINPYSFNEQVSYNTNGFGYGSQNGHSLPLDPRQDFHSPQNVGAVPEVTIPPTNVSMGRRKKATTASTGGSSGGTTRNKSGNRARRGEATDPHSIAERLRRERIAERMKALQELVPNGNKTDKASMLDEIIDYVKFLQLQVKIVSMSRLGAGRGLGSLPANMSSEGSGLRRTINGSPATLAENNNMRTTENQVAKLMEEDMGSAMQYLQGKGLCLMPISLASAISTGSCGSRNPLPPPRADVGNNIVNNMATADQPPTTVASVLVIDDSITDASNK